jgi:putative hemolysin
MDGDGRSIIFFAVVLFIFVLFFLYALAENALTEIPNGRVKAFEHEKGTKHTLFSLTKKPAKLHTFFMQIHALCALFTFILSTQLAVLITNPIFYMISDGKAEHHIYDDTGSIIRWILTCLIGLVALSVIFHALPRSIVLSMSAEETERMALFFTPLVRATLLIFTPVIALSLAITKRPDGTEVTEEEILMMVDAGTDTGTIEESEADMITGIFEFSDTPASDIMTHRTDIAAVRDTAVACEIAAKAADSGHSRLPVMKGSIDRIIGIINVKDLLPLIIDGDCEDKNTDKTAADYLRPVIYVPESATAKNIFKKLTDSKMQMAVITDEYGGTAGIVTIEDLLETIVGSIQDEYDDESEEIHKLDDDTYIIDGLADPTDVLTELSLPLPQIEDFDTFDTMSAFLIELAGAVPDKAEDIAVTYENRLFSAMSVSDMRITKIKAERMSLSPENNSENTEK